MPSSDIIDNEAAPTKPKKAATPRRSPAVRCPANGTPTRKVATGKAITPNSAPVRTKPSSKKAEPTLFTDFLLGRPSTNRPRRKSLDVAPMEMKRSAVSRVQPPGGVKERVKQWQRASAAAVVEDALGPPSEPDDISIDLDDQSVTERDRRRIKFRKNHTHKPGRRKSGDKDKTIAPLKSVSSPRKRVVSDDHWMVDKNKKSPSRTPVAAEELSTEGQALPKDFVKSSINPPLEMKIEDWQKRTINNERPHKNKAVKPIPEKPSTFERIRFTPTMSASRDCEIEEMTSSGKRTTTPIIEQPFFEEKAQRRQHGMEDYSSPRRRTEKRRDTNSSIKEIPTNVNPQTGDVEEGSDDAFKTATYPVRSKTRQRKSASQESLAEIPVGYSAFSVLDINGGGKEITSRPVKPQRQASLSAVPKALRKVYTEGMKKVHDTVDPPRTGVNQPPSIESWLKGTSDPFLDDISVPENIFEIPKPPPRRQNYEIRDVYGEKDSNENRTHSKSGVGQYGKGRMLPGRQTGDTLVHSGAIEPLANPIIGERKPTASDARPLEQTALKRSPATRNASSPKNIRHPLPKEAFADLYDREPQPEAHTASPITHVNSPEVSSDVRRTKDLPAMSLEASKLESNDPQQACLSSRGSKLHGTPVVDLRDLPEMDQYNTTSQVDSYTTGQRRLSTIVSVETFKTSSSLTERSSELSNTTVTRTTVTQDTSRTSNASGASDTSHKATKEPIKGLGLKGRLTMHSDLLSVLSLQESSEPGRKKSIRSACSIRTTRTRLATATIPNLLRELADDEVKYMRELKTLVDGVIPVLLTCVLSKADTAVAAGLFDRSSSGQTDALITKPIIDMGIALEQLKTCHKRIPLHDPDLLVQWAVGAHRIYEAYVNAWRMGFQNVVVNLAPASQSELAESMSLDEVPRNMDGDVLNENGERVDVAFLLKRPLLRVKYLAKVINGIHTIQPKEQLAIINDQYQDLLAKIRWRTREEEARLEDQAAASTDATRTRDLKTLDPIDGVMVDATRQVYAKDFFDLRLLHSSGQRIDCRVELIFRDKPLDKSDAGDLLICEVDSIDRWLLFPPIISDMISARAGNETQELIVMIRGGESSWSWEELFTLRATDDGTAAEWLQMLDICPNPPLLQRLENPLIPAVSVSDPGRSDEVLNNRSARQISSPATGSSGSEVPIGERRTRGTHLQSSKTGNEEHKASIGRRPPLSSHHDSPKNERESASSRNSTKDLNDAMEHAGRMVNSDLRRARAKRHRSRDLSKWPATPPFEDLHTNSDSDHQRKSKRASPPGSPCDNFNPENVCIATPQLSAPKTSILEAMAVPKQQNKPITETNEDRNLHLEGSTRSTISSQSEESRSLKGDQEVSNIAPTPPPHKALNPDSLKVSTSSAILTLTAKSRRLSSPLKHEYQPSDESGFSSAAVDSDQEDLQNSSDSSEEELEAAEITIPPIYPARRRTGLSPALSFSISPDASLAPSNSASQIPLNRTRISPSADTAKSIATISCWSEKGRWIDLHPEDCTIIVSPGLIEAYAMNILTGSSDINNWSDDGLNSPLVSLELTPIVPLRQSNAVDIEIRSPPTAKSSVECTHTVRFRSHTLEECSTLYAAIHKARMKNPVYMALEQERIVSAYGKQILETVGGNRRHSWLGRSKSYRASIRAPSDAVSENSSNSFASAISRLKNMGILGSFNIDKSSVGTSQGIASGTSSGATSAYTDTASSGNTSRTPSSPSTAMTGASKLASFGSRDLKIRLYLSVSPSKWSDIGAAFLTISHPPRGMRQASSLYHGVEKRIVVTKQESAKRTLVNKFQGATSPKGDGSALQLVLDVVLGGACFSRQGVVGIVMNVWEDIRGDNGEVGRVAAIGGVSGRTRRWMFHFASAAETAWVFSLVGGGVR